MNKREKILASIIGALVVGVGGYRLLLPTIDEYVFAVARENDSLRDTRDDLMSRFDEIEPFRKTYGELLARTAGTELAQVDNELRVRLTSLIEKAGLSEPRVSPRSSTQYKPPGRRSKKLNIGMLRYTVTAEGDLSDIVRFLRDFYELPYVAQVTELTLDPPTVRAFKKGGLIKMTAAIEALIPPKHDVSQINLARLVQPEKHVKHAGGDYGLIASREPFTQFVKPPPTPPVRKKDPEVKIVEKEPEPPPPEGPKGDPDRNDKVIRMVLMYGVDEVLVANTRDKTSEYVGLGGQLDGGDVLMIHPLGTVARREDGTTRVYAVGRRLSEGLPIEEADIEYPEIVYAFDAVMEGIDAESEEESEEDGEEEEDDEEEEEEEVDGPVEGEAAGESPVNLGDIDPTGEPGDVFGGGDAGDKKPVRPTRPRNKRQVESATKADVDANKKAEAGETPAGDSQEKSSESDSDAKQETEGSNEDG